VGRNRSGIGGVGESQERKMMKRRRYMTSCVMWDVAPIFRVKELAELAWRA
jgi:hypothetical protein